MRTKMKTKSKVQLLMIVLFIFTGCKNSTSPNVSSDLEKNEHPQFTISSSYPEISSGNEGGSNLDSTLTMSSSSNSGFVSSPGSSMNINFSSQTGISSSSSIDVILSSSLGVAPTCNYQLKVWENCTQYPKTTMSPYIIRNNFWNMNTAGAGSQCVWAASSRCWGVNAEHANGTGQVKSYPSLVRGWTYWDGYTTTNHGLGIAVSSLSRAFIRWKMDAPDNGRFIALWDVYLDNTANPGNGADYHPHTNLMIHQRLVDESGWFQEWVSNLPIITLGGKEFRYRVENGASMSASNRVIKLFLRPAEGDVMGEEDSVLDLKAIIDGLATTLETTTSDGFALASGMHLVGVQAGYEIIDGGTFVTEDSWVVVQNEPIP
jgi:hypothetical protein